jgi:hypothetical protein
MPYRLAPGPIPLPCPSPLFPSPRARLHPTATAPICSLPLASSPFSSACACFFLIPLGILVHVNAVEHRRATLGSQALSLACIEFGIVAITLLCLGIGSIMARKWARALMLIFSWLWLVVGGFFVLFFSIFLPIALSLRAVPGYRHPVDDLRPGIVLGFVIIILFVAFFFAALPIIWIRVYGSPDVIATCAARNPRPGWTDDCPLPVLGLSLYLCFSGLMEFVVAFLGHQVVPFFGIYLTGMAAITWYLAAVALHFVTAFFLYFLNRFGWWLCIALLFLTYLSSIITFLVNDPMTIYRLMHFSQASIAHIQASGTYRLRWVYLFLSFPILGYLLWIKHYFAPGPHGAPQATPLQEP